MQQLSPTSQQQESCVSILSYPSKATSPSPQSDDRIVPPPPLFLFFENTGAAWTRRGVGDRILHKVH